jgi:hypothetical protein
VSGRSVTSSARGKLRSPGEAVAWRVGVRIQGTRDVGLVHVSARTVVHDTPTEVAVYMQPDYPDKRRNTQLGGPITQKHRPVIALRDGWRDQLWPPWRVLTIKRPNDDHSISLSWRADTGEFAHWYIDLTSPLRRSSVGFDLLEHGLDLVVDAEMRFWHWKDEEELTWAVAQGTYTKREGEQIYAEGGRALERLRREAKHLERWIPWRPDPGWARPQLPTSWDRD